MGGPAISQFGSKSSFTATATLIAAVFISSSLLRFPVPGVNEPHYLCKARAFSDTDWCSGDFFLQSSNAHAVFFALTGPVTEWIGFEATAVTGRILCLGLMATAWSMLSIRLRLKFSDALLAAATFCGIAITGNFSGEWVVGGFESKVPAYGFALISVAFWLDAWRSLDGQWKTYLFAGIFAGLAAALHPVVGVWFCIGIALSELFLWCGSLMLRKTEKLRPLRTFTVHGLVFAGSAFVFSLPGLVPAAKMVLSSESTAAERDQANLIQIFWRLAHHLDPSTFPKSAWIHTTILLSVTVVGLLSVCQLSGKTAGLNKSPDTPSAEHDDVSWRLVSILLLMSLLIAAAGIAIGWRNVPVTKMSNWQLRASLLKFYPFRFFDTLLPITASFVLAGCAGRLLHRFALWRWMLTAIVCVVVLATAHRHRLAAPSGYSPTSFAAWKEACQWLKNNVPDDSLIYGPREGFGLKWYADRAEYVCFKDCPQDAAGILEWNRRLWVVHDWSQESYSDGSFDKADLQKFHQLTSATHILTRRLGPFESPPIYKNHVWRIYSVPLPVQTNERSR